MCFIDLWVYGCVFSLSVFLVFGEMLCFVWMCVGVSLLPMFICGSSWFPIDVLCVLFACRHMIAFSPCLCSLRLGKVLRPAYGGCDTDQYLSDDIVTCTECDYRRGLDC
jgi:hypothetical protein